MFRSLEDTAAADLAVQVDGEAVRAFAGETVLALLLRLGRLPLRRTAIENELRGPLCAMGVCQECLVEIDDLGLRPACLLPVRGGMRIRRNL